MRVAVLMARRWSVLQAAFDQQAQHRLAQAGAGHDRGLHARAHRGVDVREHAQPLVRQRAASGDRLAQATRGAVLRIGQRAERLDGDEAFDALRRRGGEDAADRRAHRMAEHGETLPAQRVGGVEHGVHGAG
jgi:hypothetical protein